MFSTVGANGSSPHARRTTAAPVIQSARLSIRRLRWGVAPRLDQDPCEGRVPLSRRILMWRDHHTVTPTCHLVSHQRIAALAQVNPDPNAVRTRRSPRESRPAHSASWRAIGIDAAVVLPYL